ncbi:MULTISPECIES: DUF6602 domain-containing protein [Klebsiella pneumoniae complex]|uniref:DUF6602 domain-containing protein n=1 Tax=Klebsiella pneumoniae complex TaxID=3390273 RepID=UPI001CD300E1|nr:MULTISPECIES: DUF6602 domain-containing protein [Klebsiella]HDH1371129.1 hypothetical protein [Klebsiella quasipneumoniae subsp. similipneumoniae]
MISFILYERLSSVLDMLNANYRSVKNSPSAVKGVARSDFVNNYLKSSVPQGLRISTSGEIIDNQNNCTGELDIILENGYFPNIPILNIDSARLYFAESVAAVIEVKSNLQGQWQEAVATGEKLQAITRNFGNSTVSSYHTGHVTILNTVFNSPNLPKVELPRILKKIPYFVVGYTGWEKNETLKAKLDDTKGVVSGILQLDRGVFISDDNFKSIEANGPLSLLAFIDVIYESFNFIKSTNADLLAYGRK